MGADSFQDLKIYSNEKSERTQILEVDNLITDQNLPLVTKRAIKNKN